MTADRRRLDFVWLKLSAGLFYGWAWGGDRNLCALKGCACASFVYKLPDAALVCPPIGITMTHPTGGAPAGIGLVVLWAESETGCGAVIQKVNLGRNKLGCENTDHPPRWRRGGFVR